MPEIELAWYASFLKNMHGILFIAIILGNVVDWIIHYGLEQNRLDEFAGHGEYLEGGGPETGTVELNEEGKPETIIKDENKKLHKEYYEVTLSEAIETIKICIKFSGTTLISEDKFYLDYKMSRSTQLNGFEINAFFLTKCLCVRTDT